MSRLRIRLVTVAIVWTAACFTAVGCANKSGRPDASGTGSSGGPTSSGGIGGDPTTPGATGATSGAAGASSGGGGSRATLDIHWIDVEGGAATLMVAPTGETLLVDGGFSGSGDRDIGRVLALLGQLGISRLDHVVTTHYHIDHVGGVTALAARVPVGEFIDHGPTVEGDALFSGYMTAIAGKKRTVVRPGDRFALGEVAIQFLTAAGEVIEPPPPGAPANPACEGATMMPERPTDENPQSAGFVARFGSFDFLDLGDLTWQVEHRLVCPLNRVGVVDLFQVNHHGLSLSNSPQLLRGVSPLVAVMNNGATKGGDAATFTTLFATPGLEAVWQLHRAQNNDDAHNTMEALIANISVSPDGAYGVKASVERDGRFTLTNQRTGLSRSYTAR